jgi:hypothetical protein
VPIEVFQNDLRDARSVLLYDHPPRVLRSLFRAAGNANGNEKD